MNPQSFVLFAILLGVLITVHELGHFLFAKLLNVKVLRFSIGFGPRIVGFTRGETEYRIAWIPLGGYVKMAGELPHDEENPEDAKRGFLAQPPWKRALIVIGGPAFNLIFPVLLYFFVFFGAHERDAAVVRHVQPGLPAAMAGILPGDRILSVEGKEVISFEQVLVAISERSDQQTRLLVERGGERVERILTPAAAFQADVFSDVRGQVGIGAISPEPLLGVPAGSPAEAAGLRTFDRVVSVNGETVADLYSLNLALQQVAPGEEVALEVARLEPLRLPGIGGAQPLLRRFSVPRQPGDGLRALGAEESDLYVARVFAGGPAATAGLQRGDRLVAVDGKPLTSFGAFQIALARAEERPFDLEWRSGDQTKRHQVRRGKFETVDPLGQKIPMQGVGIASLPSVGVYDPEVERVTVEIGFGEALRRAALRVPEDIARTVMVIGRLFTGDLPFGTVGGPIMMFQLTSKSTELGVAYFLSLMGIISVNLGIMNLLPIPILDGFALLSAIWEGVRRRPIPVRAREIANMVGLAMLVILMVMVFKNDLTR